MRSPSQLAHNVGPSMAHQRYAIEMAYRWQAIGGRMLCAFFFYLSKKKYNLGV